MSYKEFKVSGLSCQHCVAKVRTALESLPEVKSVSVSQQENIVRIEANNIPDVDSLNELLEDYGNYRLSE